MEQVQDFSKKIVIALNQDLKNLLKKLQVSNFLWIAYVQDMIDTADDFELVKVISTKTSNELDLLGIGIFATKDELKLLTGKLSLWK